MNSGFGRQVVNMAVGVAMAVGMAASLADNDNGRGRHKQLYAVPTPGPVVIDGRLDDWDLSGQIEMFVIEATRATQSAKFALMYDAEALYLSGDVNDPTPMMNRHDPKVAPHKAWDADACQFRLTIDPAVGYPILDESSFKYRGANPAIDTRDDIVHLLLWHYTDDASANLQMHLGMSYRVPRPEWAPHGLVPPEHFQGAYLKREDGTGYSFEYRIPWSTLKAKRPLAGGDIVAGTVQFNWSRPDGLKTAGGSAWAYDVMSGPGFVFQSTACWGKIIYSETGQVSRELVSAGVPPERPLPLEFAYELPEDSQCTVQLFDQAGKSVRILVAQQDRLGGRNIERWDGLDQQGNLLPAGDYVWKGVHNQPIKAEYRFSAHNSGQPAYPTDNNKGGWGGDHGSPQTVCALADGMLLAWDSCEYGWGIIRTDLEGRKQWGAKHDATHMATDGQRLYIAGGHGFNAAAGVQLLEVKDSRPSRFANGVATVAAPPGGEAADNRVSGLAWRDGKLYVAYAERNLVGVFETVNGGLVTSWSVPAPGRLAVRPDGSLAVISQGQVVTVAADGTVAPWLTTHLDEPVGVAVAADGSALVANRGGLQNVSVFAADGSFLRSIGKPGGRPAKGAYDPSGMYMAGGIALDSQGRLWVAETTDGPKRISVWDTATGANLKEFFGGSGYFGYGFIDPDRPDEIYAHHVLWTIDWDNYTVKPATTIWRQTAANMAPAPAPDGYCAGRPLRIMTAANGRQYMWGKTRGTALLLRRDGDLFKPFAALLKVDKDGKASDGIALIGADGQPATAGVYLWQDGNDDQIVQVDEVVELPKRGFERAEFAWLERDLSVRLSTGHRLSPQRLAESGQPVYDWGQLESTYLVGNPLGGGYYMLDEEDGGAYTYAGRKGPAMIKWTADGQMAWHYADLPRWHDSLNLPMVKAGRLWGLTGFMGLAGDYFANQTYFGINHIFRRDGQYIGAVLGDGRVGGRGAYEGQPEGQGGQFVKLKVGDAERYFVIHGGQDSRVWEVVGLDTVQDLPGGVYRHSEELVAKAQEAQAAYAAAVGGVRQLLVARGRPALEVGESAGKKLEDGRAFAARLAYDADNLYVRFEVTAPVELVNAIADPQILFRGGNLLDIQIGADPQADPERQKPAAGDLRLLVTRQERKPLAVLYRPKVKDFAGQPIVLTSPTGQESFDRIEVVESVGLEYRKTGTGFVATVTIPHALSGLAPAPGQSLKLDLGYIYGNKEGTRTAIRSYVFNNSFSANVVDDIPNESRLEPGQWGTATVE